MALPKIEYPLHDVVIPSTKAKIRMRPMLVKEEKILLMAKAAEEDTTAILPAIKQVVNNCIVDEKVDVDSLAMFDLEYLFLRLRAFSVNNIAKITFQDLEDGKNRDFELDLDKVEVKWPEKVYNKIEVPGTKVVLVLQYPRASIYDDTELVNIEDPDEQLTRLAEICLEKIYDGDKVTLAKNATKEEIRAFFESLDLNTYQRVREFFQSQPRLYHKIEYKNDLGNERVIELQTLTDFFTLG